MQAEKVLHNLLIKSCPNMHKNRQEALAATVQGALTGQRLTVTDLGRSIPGQTRHKHSIKRADRLLSNVHPHQANHPFYRALAHLLITPESRPVIVIDWSDMDEDKQHFLLRASLAAAGRSVTLYEEVHAIDTKERLVTHRTFLDQLQTIIPAGCRPILVTEAGLRTTWFKLVASLGWDWVGRVRNRHDMRWGSGGRWFDAKRCYQQAPSRPHYPGAGVLTIRNQVPCQFVPYRGKRQGRKHKNRSGDVARNADSRKKAQAQREPWLLATSLPVTSTLAKKVVAIYRLRMTIEEGFRDIKSHRFCLRLNYHRTVSTVRLQM